MKLASLAFAAILLPAGTDARAGTVPIPGSGAYFLSACQHLSSNAPAGTGDALMDLSCGLTIGELAGTARSFGNQDRFCKPVSVTIPQMAAVAVGYMNKFPDRRDKSFNVLALAAFHDAWPCR